MRRCGTLAMARQLLAALAMAMAAGPLALVAQGAFAKEGPARVEAEPLRATDASPVWSAPQFVQADKEGRVFVLRADTLDLFQIGAGDKLLSRGALESMGSADSGRPAVIRQAVMSSAGDVWLLLDSAHQVRLFRSGKEKPLPANDWIVTALAVVQGTPVLAVAPGQVANGRDPGESKDPKQFSAKPPFLLQMGDSRWETLVPGESFELGDTRASIGREIQAGSEVWAVPGPGGSLWIAYRNAYRLLRYSALGKLKDQIVVGDGKVKWAERSAEDWARLEAVAKEDQFPFKRSGVAPVQEAAVVRAMTMGRDGRVYLLVETEKGLAIDRFDPEPSRQALERVALDGLGSGRYTMAAGRDALYIAAFLGNGGRWRLPWESLESAQWAFVDEVAVNRQASKVAESRSEHEAARPWRRAVAAEGLDRLSGSLAEAHLFERVGDEDLLGHLAQALGGADGSDPLLDILRQRTEAQRKLTQKRLPEEVKTLLQSLLAPCLESLLSPLLDQLLCPGQLDGSHGLLLGAALRLEGLPLLGVAALQF